MTTKYPDKPKYDIPENSECAICGRTDIHLEKYGFNEPKQIVDFSDLENPVKNNDRAFEIITCVTDMQLIIRIKKALNRHPREILEAAISYRRNRPIRPQ